MHSQTLTRPCVIHLLRIIKFIESHVDLDINYALITNYLDA